MALGIIVIFSALVIFVLMIFMMLSHLDSEHKTVGTGQDFLTQPPEPKTLQEILKEALKDPPVGCMWEVKKKIKHVRALPTGKVVFDGSVDVAFAEITLITPYNNRTFSLAVENLMDFEKSVRFNSQSLLKDYNKQLQEIESKNKQINDEWDGVYS